MRRAYVWLLRFCVAVCAGAALLFTAPAALATDGSISGTVTNAAGGAALQNIEVDVYSGTTFTAQVCTQSNGTYTAGGLAPGTYTVAFNPANGFCGVRLNFQIQYYDDQSTFGSATPIQVNSGATTTGIDAALQAGGSITGTVTASGGSTGLPSVEVDLNGGSSVTCTASDGSYSFIGLATGSYTVAFNPAGTLCGTPLNYVSQTASNVSVTAPAAHSGVDAALVAGAVISGTVKTGSPATALAGVQVELFDSSQKFIKETCSAADGSYSLENLPAGSYYVSFSTPGSNCSLSGGYVTQYYPDAASFPTNPPVTVGAGATQAGIDALMQASGSISGTVTDSVTHAGIQNVGVNVTLGSTVLEVCTDAGGHYTARGLGAGTYTVSFQPVSGCGTLNSYSDASYPSPVQLSTGQTVTGIDIALGPHASFISGTVTSAADGQGIGGITVEASDATGDFGSACTGSDGSYSISPLPAGSYTVVFNPQATTCGPAQDLVQQTYNGPRSSGGTVSVDGSTGVSGVDAALQSGGAIAGTVTDAGTRQPVADIPVLVYTPAGAAAASGCTGADGTYSIPGLATGTYTVVFSGSLGSCGATHRYADQSQTGVQVVAGATTSGVNAQMLPQTQGGITGTVTAAGGSGAPLAGIAVTLYDAAGNPVGSAAVTSVQGTYSILDIPAGAYHVGFSDPSGRYAAQFYAGAATLAGATPIVVTGGTLSRSIDAAMSPSLPPSSATTTSTRTATPTPTARLSVVSGHVLAITATGMVTIRLACAGSGQCAGLATLVVTQVTHVRHRKRISHLAIATARFRLAPGQTAALPLRLSRLGRTVVAAHRARLIARLTVLGSASGIRAEISATVRLKRHAPGRP